LLSQVFLVGIPFTVGFRPQLVVVSSLSVGIPLTVGFRPQHVVVSGLLVGIPLTVGFTLSQSLWLSQSPFTNSSSFTMEFWLSRSLSHELSFSKWNLGYHEAFLMISFFTMESRLSRSLFTTFSFTWWNLGFHEAFHTNFSFFTVESRLSRSLSYKLFFFHTRISAITKPFIRTFLFSRWNIGYHGAFHSNFSFSRWNISYHGASSRLFLSHGGIHKMHDLGENSFHIYHKEYLHRIRLV
jgi:hypothetical protein